MNRIHRTIATLFLAATCTAGALASATAQPAQPTEPAQVSAAAAFAERIAGTWRADLNAIVAGRIAQADRPGLAAIFGAVANDLLGENYGIVEARADGTGAARGIWMQDEFDGTGTYTLHDVDEDQATIHIVAPESGVDHRFRIRIVSEDQIDAIHDGQTVVFRRI